MIMKERIKDMIHILRMDDFEDREQVHIDYDKLLEELLLNYDEKLFPLIKELIYTEKHFWYA